MPLKPGQQTQWHLCLADARARRPEWYLQLENGFQSATIDFLAEDSNNLSLSNVGKRIGDFDEQVDWKGGRGGERFSDDPTKFWDSLNLWTNMTGHVTPTLLWQYATGYRDTLTYLPGTSKSVSWRSLISSTRFIASDDLTALTAADKAKVWIRRVGSPGTLTCELRAASGSMPNGAVRVSSTVTTTTVTDLISVFHTFDWTGTSNVTAGDFLVLYGAATDNATNHWEVAVDAATSNSMYSSSGTGTWSAAGFSLYYRITPADVAKRWFFFNNGTKFCAVDVKGDGTTASQLYSIGTDAALTEVGTTGLGVVTSRPAIGNAGKVYFPQGEAVNIRTWDGNTTFADDGTNKASFLSLGYDSAIGPLMWAGHTSASANNVAYAALADTLNFGATAKNVGRTGVAMQGLGFWTDGGLYVGFKDSVYKCTIVSNAITPIKQEWGVGDTPSTYNFTYFLPHNGFLYTPWLFSIVRCYGTQVDDVGQGWEGAGLPNGREGRFSAGTTYASFQFHAVDAGASGTSCVMCYDGVTWSEVFRAPAAGLRIRDVAVQPIDDSRAKLWIDLGGDLVYLILPLNKARPIDDASTMYQHEGVLISSVIDCGAASKLKKLVTSITVSSANLDGGGIRIEGEYQTDDKVGLDGASNWTPFTQPFLRSPESTVPVNAFDIMRFRYRLRLLTDNNTKPPDITSIVPNGLARGQRRRVYSFVVKGDKVTADGKTTEPNELIDYLLSASESPGSVIMSSTNRLIHGSPKGPGRKVEIALERLQPITSEKSTFVLNLIGFD